MHCISMKEECVPTNLVFTQHHQHEMKWDTADIDNSLFCALLFSTL